MLASTALFRQSLATRKLCYRSAGTLATATSYQHKKNALQRSISLACSEIRSEGVVKNPVAADK